MGSIGRFRSTLVAGVLTAFAPRGRQSADPPARRSAGAVRPPHESIPGELAPANRGGAANQLPRARSPVYHFSGACGVRR
jgi:hypothetical protein